jgi:4-diphosphocytidyl-2-C-methyl-D-erythritol kinase
MRSPARPAAPATRPTLKHAKARYARVRIEACAKLNLGVAVGPRRGDGFHDLATFFQSVSLADTLIVTPRRRGFELVVGYENAALRGGTRGRIKTPGGAQNLVLRAARLVAKRTGLAGGARFRLVKRIPIRSGLGGGSADGAAAIAALDVIYGLRLGRARRLALATELGSDVPFAITGGTALGLGRGEKLEPLELDREFRAVIAVPEWGVSTARAYAKIDRKKFGLTGWKAKLRFAKKQLAGRLKSDRALELGNTFERVLGRRRVSFGSLCERLRAAGVRSPALSGSGSAVFGFIEPGIPLAVVARAFEGSESLYAVHTRRRGLRVLSGRHS